MGSAEERHEQPLDIGTEHARASIIDADADRIGAGHDRDTDPFARRRVRQCVAQQVVEDAVQHFRVTVYHGIGFGDELEYVDELTITHALMNRREIE